MTIEHNRLPHDHPDLDERVDTILEMLRRDGGRVTTGRRAIVQALYSGPDHHVTAEDLAALVQAEQPDVHLSTVYRTLDALEGLGVVDRVTLGAGGAVYHLADHEHLHLVCDVCGSVTEISPDAVVDLRRRLADDHGFALTSSHLVLRGTCRDCARRGAG